MRVGPHLLRVLDHPADHPACTHGGWEGSRYISLWPRKVSRGLQLQSPLRTLLQL